MGMSVGGGRRRAMAEINVTPLVDVMLVLLVIFMVTAPVLKEGFQVEVPQASETQSINVVDARSVIITRDGEVLRNLATSPDDRYEKLSQLVGDLRTWKAERESTPEGKAAPPVVVIVGDKEVRYERIIQVWNAVRSAGIAQVGFQIEAGTALAAR
ncbi:MAG: biopolymer transporter ExbD [Planctomycetes bacterium]|nr:biopolymer transporter ExbD [Planctomycetota bacterium]